MARERYNPVTRSWSSSYGTREEEAPRKRRRSSTKRKTSKRKRTVKRRTTTKRRATMARRRGRRKSVASRAVAPKRRRRRRSSGRVVRRATARVKRRRTSTAPKIRIRRRRRSKSFSTKGIVGQVKQMAFDGAWTVAGGFAGNMAKIMSGQTGLAGNAVQLAGGIAAGFIVGKYVNKDAARFVMAGAAASIVHALVIDNLLPSIPASNFKTQATAALQGYPHSEYAASLNGYPNVGMTRDAMGLPDSANFGVDTY